jgi:hypothetical protein
MAISILSGYLEARRRQERRQEGYSEGLGSPLTDAGGGFRQPARPDPPDTGLLSDHLGVVKSRTDCSESRDNWR